MVKVTISTAIIITITKHIIVITARITV
jgi:hypothetical protein